MGMNDGNEEQPVGQEMDMSEAGPSDMDDTQNQGAYRICVAVIGENEFYTYKEELPKDFQSLDVGSKLDTFQDALRATLPIYKENPAPGAGAEAHFQAGFQSPDPKY